MASKMLGGSHAQHVKAGKQSHQHEAKHRTSRGGQSAKRSRSSEPVTSSGSYEEIVSDA